MIVRYLDMRLTGWDYVGRNIDDSLHRQFRIIVDCLSDPTFVKKRSWGHEIQVDLAKKLGTSPGQIRTIKRICEDLGLFKKGSLNRTDIPSHSSIMTEAGAIVHRANNLEQLCKNIDDNKKRDEALNHIKGLYEEGYVMALVHYYYKFPTNPPTRLHPLRATLKAFRKYGSLDKWEWYLLNTDILADDNPEMEASLEQHITAYRRGELTFTMANVVEKPKGHQYLPQFFQYAGLVNLLTGRNWRISDNDKHQDVKKRVLSENFLTEIYGER
jgi:hypothetical protein